MQAWCFALNLFVLLNSVHPEREKFWMDTSHIKDIKWHLLVNLIKEMQNENLF